MSCATCAACNCRKMVGGDDELIERARIVAVLDAWAGSTTGAAHRTWDDGGEWCCVLTFASVNNPKRFDGATPDEARAKAAAWCEANP